MWIPKTVISVRVLKILTHKAKSHKGQKKKKKKKKKKKMWISL